VPKQSVSESSSTSKEKQKKGKKVFRTRIVEMTAWVPSVASPHVKAPAAPFWLANGIVGAEMREDEFYIDLNINDAGIRQEIEVTVRGSKEKIMHSLYFFQFVFGTVTDEDDVPKGPMEAFRPSSLALSNGMPPGGIPGMGGGPRA
jgi:hypothetical protein